MSKWVSRSICFTLALCLYAANSPAESPPSPVIPPEVLKKISELSHSDLQIPPIQNKITPLQRLELSALGILILVVGIFLCRYLAVGYPNLTNANGIFGLLGLFGAVAALCLACAAVGMMIHLAAAACTVVSGFSIAAFLLPQFHLTRNWIVPTTPPDTDQS